ELTNKDKVLTNSQRFCFDRIYPNYDKRFRGQIPAVARTQSGMVPSTTNNETRAIAGGRY
ncbi:unnamed protein product, partial [Rotaria sordida]